ncbi:hypothetical protein AVEN_144651-1 [Araneus ventricosus]|uniref:Uncharacterized protein n=1 Tax=Araneus ventricosus TaxID=182803 RepID=A0A4Y2E349_ARAVE|nr:hypothetical protein AVEN_144651-1 [Araneus ventricosus]
MDAGSQEDMNVPFLKQHEGYFGTDLVILNHGQMTRTIPELASSLKISAPHQLSSPSILTDSLFPDHPYRLSSPTILTDSLLRPFLQTLLRHSPKTLSRHRIDSLPRPSV